MGVSGGVRGRAVICGSSFGDKMTPLSETTILVPRLVGGGLTTAQHIRNMVRTSGPALGTSLAIFLVPALTVDAGGDVSTREPWTRSRAPSTSRR